MRRKLKRIMIRHLADETVQMMVSAGIGTSLDTSCENTLANYMAKTNKIPYNDTNGVLTNTR